MENHEEMSLDEQLVNAQKKLSEVHSQLRLLERKKETLEKKVALLKDKKEAAEADKLMLVDWEREGDFYVNVRNAVGTFYNEKSW